MYLTPIIYPESMLPNVVLSIVRINPLYYYVSYFRDVLIYGQIPSLGNNLICLGFSLMSFVLGLYIFKKGQDKFTLYI